MYYENINQMMVELEQTLCNEQYTILTYIPTTKVTKRRIIDMLSDDGTVLSYNRFISFINTFLLDQQKITKLKKYISPEFLKKSEYTSILPILQGMTLAFVLTDHFIRILGNNINEKFKFKYYEKVKNILVIKPLYDTFVKFSVDTLFNIYSNHVSRLMTHDTKHIISTDDLPNLNLTIEKLFSIHNKIVYKQDKPFFSKYVTAKIYDRDLIIHCLIPNFDKIRFNYFKNEKEYIELKFPDYHYALFKVVISLSGDFNIKSVFMRVLNKNSFEDESQINLLSTENFNLVQQKSKPFPFNTYRSDSKVCLGDISKEVHDSTVFDVGNVISKILYSGLNNDLTDREVIDRIEKYYYSDIYYLEDNTI